MRTLAIVLAVTISVVLGGPGNSARAGSIEAVLAASWQPAFCSTAAGRKKEECRTQTPDRYDATNFSLHGLWPDDLDNKAAFPCYCGRGVAVSCETSGPRDRNLWISPKIMDRLRIVMPGTMSGLQRHQWSKHGSCYVGAGAGEADPDDYFADAITLVEKLNDSAVGDLFREKLGSLVTREEIEAAFDRAFGEAAAERVTIVCNGRGRGARIAELRINVSGDVTPDSDLGDLILAAPTAADSSDRRSCGKGLVVEVTE
jgi:ribonuclease T2